MWNLGKLEPLRETFVEPGNFYISVEPHLCETLGNLLPGFWALPQTTTKLYWKNPKLFVRWGEQKKGLDEVPAVSCVSQCSPDEDQPFVVASV